MGKPAKSALLGSTPTTARDPAGIRDRHGFRGVPPPATFDIYTLPDTAPLTDLEVCSVLRVSTNTTGAWRKRGIHLEWFTLPNGQVRSTVGAVKAFLASGKRRTRTNGSPPSAIKPKAARRSSSRRRPAQPASGSPERTTTNPEAAVP